MDVSQTRVSEGSPRLKKIGSNQSLLNPIGSDLRKVLGGWCLRWVEEKKNELSRLIRKRTSFKSSDGRRFI